MKGPTKEIRHLPVPCVTRPLMIEKFRDMKGPTKEKNHLLVPSVTRPLIDKNDLMGQERIL